MIVYNKFNNICNIIVTIILISLIVAWYMTIHMYVMPILNLQNKTINESNNAFNHLIDLVLQKNFNYTNENEDKFFNYLKKKYF